MRHVGNLAAAVALAALLAACSGSGNYFETEGLRAPEGSCTVKPSNVGLAERIRDIDEGNGCEVRNAWRLESAGSVSFSQPATMNCGMAEPLAGWIEETVQPAAHQNFGESVVSVDVAASYSCRPRNNQRGAKMSEHGFGNAIDISAFTLRSGRKVTVLKGWSGSADERRFLGAVHDQACGGFSTVLGPEADRFHRDNLHLDMQNRKNRSRYCR